MRTIHSKLTSQGQISVPSEIRKKLGIGPGSVIEWEEKDGEIVVRRSGRYSSQDVHAALFPNARPTKKTLRELKQGVGDRMRKKHARD